MPAVFAPSGIPLPDLKPEEPVEGQRQSFWRRAGSGAARAEPQLVHISNVSVSRGKPERCTASNANVTALGKSHSRLANSPGESNDKEDGSSAHVLNTNNNYMPSY